VTEHLVEALEDARGDFMDALAEVDEALVTAPGVVGEWSVRDLVVHVAVWADHASRALDLAAAGRGEDFAYSTDDTDAMNERILAEARSTSPAEALGREEAAFDGLRRRVTELDPGLLSLSLGNGDSVEDVIRYDGPDHYAEHAGHLRAWFAGDDDADDEDDDGDR
jgi:hypothetical protein